MNSRPFEGGVLTAALLAMLFPTLREQFGTNQKLATARLLLPAAAIVLAGAVFLAIYNHRVTGKYTRLPYQVNRETYGWPENLAILRPKKLQLHDAVLRNMHELEVGHRSIYKSVSGLLDNLVTRLFDNWAYLIGPALTIPLLFGLFCQDRKARSLLLLLLAMALLNLLQMLLYPYHLAPVVPVIFCLIALGCQQLFNHLWRLGEPRALAFAGLLPVSLLLSTGVKQFGDQLDVPASSYWERGYEWHRYARAAVIDWLQVQSGRHLVIVRYASNHPVNQEWVYNGADIDGSRIIWAREEDAQSNQELPDYYSKRHFWLVEADTYPQRVVPYKPMDAGESATPVRCAECTMASKAKAAAAY